MGIGSEGYVGQALPAKQIDGTLISPRFGKYKENFALNLLNGQYALADEGTYFVGTNPTISTAIAFGGAAITAYTDTTAGLTIYNKDILGGKNIYVDYIKLLLQTIATGTLAAPFQRYVFTLDPLSTRYTSGGSLITPVNPNGAAGQTSIASVHFGACVTVALSTNGRLIDSGCYRSATQVANDTYTWDFGGVEKVSGGNSLALATAGTFLFTAPPIIIPPGWVFAMQQFCGGQTAAPAFEFGLGWWER